MRRFDKKTNIQKANILAEQRYLVEKSMIVELDMNEEYNTEESFKDYSNDALTDMIINLSRFENNESIIKRVKAELERRKQSKLNKVDELDMQSYASAMDNTESYPWTNFISGDYNNPKSLGNKKARVNTLARERFTTEFYKKYPVGTEIITTDGVYFFDWFKFTTNYSSYYLTFKNNENNRITFSYSNSSENGIYIDGLISDSEIKILPESIPLVQEMLKYNIQARK
jgi:hypothetical protein